MMKIDRQKENEKFIIIFSELPNMEPPEEYGFDFDQVEENFEDFMEDEEAMVMFLSNYVCYVIVFI